MSTDYFTDLEGFGSGPSLPTPTDTPYQTPMASLSRRSSRAPSTLPSSSPPPMPSDREHGRTSEDMATDENISILDPRRFTPTLHASLVSEILSLRRELDNKVKFIEDLEGNLQTTKTENDILSDQLTQSNQEHRSAKRQLQQLENGTLAALEELAKERDEAKQANSELKAKLEESRKKIKSQEDDATRTHNLWERDKETWQGEKRTLERRTHVTESRLKIVLDELAAQQAAANAQHEHHVESEGEDTRDSGFGNESDTTSVRSMSQRGSGSRNGRHARNMSSSSHRSVRQSFRHSVLSGTGSETHGKLNGVSLADELNLEEEEEEDLEELETSEDDMSEHELQARKAYKFRQSMMTPDEKAKRVLGITDEPRPSLSDTTEVETPKLSELPAFGNGDLDPSRDSGERATMSTVEEEQPPTPEEPRPEYVDTGIQYTPPSSPRMSPERASMDTLPPRADKAEKMFERTGSVGSIGDIEANQRRKRITIPAMFLQAQQQPGQQQQQQQQQAAAQKHAPIMVSASSQTTDEPLSPPATPHPSAPASPNDDVAPQIPVELVSASTQTDPLPEPEPKIIEVPLSPSRAPPPLPIPIPSIAIHPPPSAPSSPKEAMLPPGTKNAESQTDFESVVPMRSMSMQTEPIRIDKRPIKLPPHLLPSAISSRTSTPEPPKFKGSKDVAAVLGKALFDKTDGDPPPRTRPMSPPTVILPTEDKYPGNNDDGPLTQNQRDSIRRPFRSSSLFAGFDGPSSDEGEDIGEDDMSEEEEPEPEPEQRINPLRMHPTRSLKHKRPFTNPPTPVPEEKEGSPSGRSIDATKGKGVVPADGRPSRNSLEKAPRVAKAMRMSSSSRQGSMRRSTLIQNGTTAHMQQDRPRSPSVGSADDVKTGGFRSSKPPFPVPTRSSSRRVPISKSEGSQSPTPRSGGLFSGRNRNHRRYQHSRQDSLRKVRSAAVIPRTSRDGRPRSRSPPVSSEWSRAASPPQIPPLPKDSITSPQYGYYQPGISHRSQPSTNTAYTGSGSVGSSVQQTSVVDAIAATMVGEWMWKYVRRRKSFGVPESPQELGKTADDGSVNVTGNGVRHKRWVWLSPYERAVMWSSKQPTSGSALMGKSGRKLTIQSVLDVKDDTPLPRGAGVGASFHRSILILTPARALKFTAMTRERHYVWLSALSFLAHSSNPAPELQSLPPPPPPTEPEVPIRPSGPTLRRAPIRDSVRLAKDKARPQLGNSRPLTGLAEAEPEMGGSSNMDAPVPAAAEPPSIPRFSNGHHHSHHGRKRSLTSPRLPPPPSHASSFRSFSHNNALPPASSATYSTASSDVYSPSFGVPSGPSSVHNPAFGAFGDGSRRTSEATSASARTNFFDAVGTVRMEAFFEPAAGSARMSEEGAIPPASFSRRPGRRRGNSYRGVEAGDRSSRGTGGYEDWYDAAVSDPFKGF
ncbi:meiotic cell cortex C-terminal pleckstrin homology-domain-containing protein [Lineolata rhizophorae]|uniref:Meiotic cell cortex C-terminal pleckstrin homology-domain-containing protein n=1 Tax=Lineolata rhizophorae TaxID=578093 RepID=A0A6A6NUJ6_9PEZI|nr:meiotic cell cortex C-terminal pleckstrin homology-domain-containing protein [Lineolata rhizophorae]